MNPELKKLRNIWMKRIENKGGIIYKYVQEELINSFIKDVEELQNKNLKEYME